jgi:drug/metabolite transporter (DMT)-like permease
VTAATPRPVAGVLAALFAVTIWAGWIPVTRLGVVTRLSPEDIAALRYATAGLLLLPVLWLHRRAVPWHRVGPIAAATAGAGVPYFLLIAHGLRLANSGQGAVLGPGATSLNTALIAWWWLRERPPSTRILGLAITASGVALVLGHDLWSGAGRVGGFLMILVASAHWALFTVASRRLGLPALLNAALISVLNAVIYVPMYWVGGGFEHLRSVPFSDLALQATYQGVLAGVLALAAFSYAIERLGAAAAAGFTPLSPVLATLLGWWLLADTVDVATAIGLSAVALGVVVANRRPRSINVAR